MRSHSSQGQRGQVAVLFALAAVAIVAIAGLALDAGQAFVSQRALQAGSDTAAQSGATMLAVDYSQCVTGVTGTGDGTYSQLTLAGDVTQLAEYAAAAQGRATSAPSVTFVNYQTGSATVAPWSSVASFCTLGTWVGPSGVEVTVSDTHPTSVLGVVGINSATETAHTIALIGTATATTSGAPFGVWYELCPGGTTLAAKDQVTLLSPQWDKTTCGPSAYGPSSERGSFKGYFKLPGPLTLSSSTECVQTGPGSGDGGASSAAPAAGTTVLVPLIKTVYSFDSTIPSGSGCPAIAAKGTFDLLVEGFVSVTINSSDPASTVTGTVNSIVTGVSGLTICPVRDTGCSSPSSSSQPVAPYIWQ